MPCGLIGGLHGEGMRAALNGDGFGSGVDRGNRTGDTALLPILLIFLMDRGNVGLGHHQDSGRIPGIAGRCGADDNCAVTGGHGGEGNLRTLLRVSFARWDAKDQRSIAGGHVECVPFVTIQR